MTYSINSDLFVTPLRRRQDGASQVYESSLAYVAQRLGPAARPINKVEWNDYGGQSAGRRGRNQIPGKGERDQGRQEIRLEDPERDQDRRKTRHEDGITP